MATLTAVGSCAVQVLGQLPGLAGPPAASLRSPPLSSTADWTLSLNTRSFPQLPATLGMYA